MNSQLTNNYDNLFDPLTSNLLSKRVKNDCEMLLKMCGNINININIKQDIINKSVIVELSKQEGQYINTYSFMIPRDYPFSPPKFKINEMSYCEFYKLHSSRFEKVLQYIKGINCLCCHSYLCKNNWSPGLRLEHLLNEIIEYKKLKYYICLKLLADKIKEKYLHLYIDLDSWLFNIACPNICLLDKPL